MADNVERLPEGSLDDHKRKIACALRLSGLHGDCNILNLQDFEA